MNAFRNTRKYFIRRSACIDDSAEKQQLGKLVLSGRDGGLALVSAGLLLPRPSPSLFPAACFLCSCSRFDSFGRSWFDGDKRRNGSLGRVRALRASRYQSYRYESPAHANFSRTFAGQVRSTIFDRATRSSPSQTFPTPTKNHFSCFAVSRSPDRSAMPGIIDLSGRRMIRSTDRFVSKDAPSTTFTAI